MKKNFLATATLVSMLALSGSVVFAVDTNAKKSITNEFKPAEISIGVVENTSSTQPVTEATYTLTESKGTLGVDKPVEIINLDATNSNSADAFIRATIVPMWITDSSDENDNAQNFVVGAMDGIIDDNVNKTIAETAIVNIDEDDPTVTSIMDIQQTYVTNNDNDYLDIDSFKDLTSISLVDSSGNYLNSFTLGDVTFTLVDGWYNDWIFNPNDGYFYYKYVVGVGEKTTQLLSSVSINNNRLYRYNGDPITLKVDVLADSVQALGGALDDVWSDFGITRATETTEEGKTTEHKYGYVLETVKEDS